MNCEYCHSTQHAYLNCPKKPDGWKPERMAKSSTASRMDVKAIAPMGVSNREANGLTATADLPLVGSKQVHQALPVDTISVQDAMVMKANTARAVAAEPAQEAQILRPSPKFRSPENECFAPFHSNAALFTSPAGAEGDKDRRPNSVHIQKASTGNADGGKPLTQTSPTKFDKKEFMKIYMREHRRGIRRRPSKADQGD